MTKTLTSPRCGKKGFNEKPKKAEKNQPSCKRVTIGFNQQRCPKFDPTLDLKGLRPKYSSMKK